MRGYFTIYLIIWLLSIIAIGTAQGASSEENSSSDENNTRNDVLQDVTKIMKCAEETEVIRSFIMNVLKIYHIFPESIKIQIRHNIASYARIFSEIIKIFDKWIDQILNTAALLKILYSQV